MRIRIPFLAVSAFLLSLLVACGGGSSSNPQAAAPPPAPVVAATGLTYTDPSGTGWRLVKDDTSTARRVVLNLVGPVGVRSRGVGFNLKAGSGVSFGLFPNQWHALDTGVFDLLNRHRAAWNTPPDPEPVFFAAGVKPGNLLTVGIFQKDRLIDAKVVSSPVLQIALELPAGSTLQTGDSVALTVTKAKALPEDIGTMDPNGWYDEVSVLAKSKPQDIQIALGTLKAK